ncbi:MAG: TolC family protein [Bacteroidales bacterium]|jgi:outer membrane protein TolC|nr:TolC family protein [Bacteroidales bacterium]
MKKYRPMILLMFIACSLNMAAQDLISLKTCYENALDNHPRAGEKQLQQQIWQLKQDNLNSAWYPKIEAGATALYNSSVADLGNSLGMAPLPGIEDYLPVVPHDQYKVTMDINQLIYDGGATKSIRLVEDAALEVKREEVEVELYAIREQVNSYYFTFILLQKQKEKLAVYLQTITEQILSLESGIRNGVLLPSDRDVLRAEKISIEQQAGEIGIRTNSTAAVLSQLTGMEINHETRALVPEVYLTPGGEVLRPELNVLDLKGQQLDAGKDLVKSERMPRAFAFATLGYGKPPGNDFFSDTFGPYYIVGAGIKWKIIDWKNSKRQQQLIDINKAIIDSHKKSLEENLDRALEMKYAEIRSLETALESDDELIATLESVRKTALSQYNNGTITASEYLREWSKEKEAVINREIHAVSLIKAKVEYLNIAGKEIE